MGAFRISSTGRTCVVSRDQFETFKRAAQKASREQRGYFADSCIIKNGSPVRVSHRAFSFVIIDQNRLRGFSLEHKPYDEKPTLEAVIHLIQTDRHFPFYAALYFLLQQAFSQKDIGPTPPFNIHMVPKPIFKEAGTDLLRVHNALTLTIGYADSMPTVLTEALQTLAELGIADNPQQLMGGSNQPNSSYQRALTLLRSYDPITEVLPLIADRE